MNLRIQTYGMYIVIQGVSSPLISFTDGTTVYDALEKGFDDLMDLCDVVINKFTVARDDFNTKEQD